jgi:hypothetical protein
VLVVEEVIQQLVVFLDPAVLLPLVLEHQVLL